MNEAAQVQAIRAELEAEGYKVREDVAGEGAGLRAVPFTLDLVGHLELDRPATDARPRLLIVEIANRSRPVFAKNGTVILGRRIPDDTAAVHRFKTLSAAIAELPERDVGFQVRFLDVSADQAAARHTSVSVRRRDIVSGLFNHDTTLLDQSLAWPMDVRALVVARLWARWLRIVARRFDRPGDLHAADLRTVQKDLYDHGVMDLEPHQYHSIHASILAVMEGGDVAWERLSSLEPHLRQVFGLVERRYELQPVRRVRVAEEVFGALRELLAEAEARGQARPEVVKEPLAALAVEYGKYDFVQALARLQLQEGGRGTPEPFLRSAWEVAAEE